MNSPSMRQPAPPADEPRSRIDQALIDRIVYNEADMAYRRRVKTIFEWLQPQDGDRILDGGCGRGFYLRFIRQVCQAQIIGVELDPLIIELARQALVSEANILLLNAHLDALPLGDGYFDKAILSEVLEHVNDDVMVLRSVARVVKPGGLIAITVPNANYPFWWDPINKTLEMLFNTHIQHGLLAGIWANHLRLYKEEELHRAVIKAGLVIVDSRQFTHHCFPFSHNLVYGFGKTMLEAGVLPSRITAVADRHNVSGNRGSALNPVNLGLRLFEWFDRHNVMDEPADRTTMNLCVLVRKL